MVRDRRRTPYVPGRQKRDYGRRVCPSLSILQNGFCESITLRVRPVLDDLESWNTDTQKGT